MTNRPWKRTSAALLAATLVVTFLVISGPNRPKDEAPQLPPGDAPSSDHVALENTSSQTTSGTSGTPVELLNEAFPSLHPAPLPLDFSSAPFERQQDGTIHKRDVMEMLQDLNSPEWETVSDLQLLRKVISVYRQIFRQNPIAGENREVVEALSGKNPYRLIFITPDHPSVDGDGALTDRWGSPFRFHPISGSLMEISSCGPDAIFGTPDDITLGEDDS